MITRRRFIGRVVAGFALAFLPHKLFASKPVKGPTLVIPKRLHESENWWKINIVCHERLGFARINDKALMSLNFD